MHGSFVVCAFMHICTISCTNNAGLVLFITITMYFSHHQLHRLKKQREKTKNRLLLAAYIKVHRLGRLAVKGHVLEDG